MADTPKAVPIPAGATFGEALPDAQATPVPTGATFGDALPDTKATPQSTIGPAPKASDIPTFGYPGQTPEERLTMPLIKGVLIPLHDVLEKATSMTPAGREEHPIMAKIGDLADNIQELLTGGQSAGKPMGTRSGLLNNPVTMAMAAAPGAAEAAPGVVDAAAQGARDAASLPSKLVNPFRAQRQAMTAADEAANAIAADSKVAAGAAPSEAGMRPALDTHIANIAARERAAYDSINAAAGTDMKSLYDKRELLQDALDDPTTANSDTLMERMKDVENQIQNGENNASKGGVDVQKALKQAKADTQQRYAVQEVKRQLFNNESVVKGNAAHGADEEINIDAAIKAVEKLDKPSRYAPEGTPSRLEQAMGKDGADEFVKALYDAQKAGKLAVKVKNLGTWAAKVLGTGLLGGAGYEAAKHLMP